MPTVCAVVLTYNRKDLLSECLDAISRQTRPCERIIVVDNGGSDGSPEEITRRFGDTIEIYRLPKNLGASGGFSKAMRIGYECGEDLLWVMDDDVIAAPDALERLLEGNEFVSSRGIDAPFVISTAWTPDGDLTNVPSIDVESRNSLSYQVWPAFLDQALVPVRRATFVSILLKRETLKSHGLPLAQMFMWSEDTEFTLRITRDGPGFLVGRSRVEHVRSAPGVLDIRTEHDPVRVGWHYYLRRNRLLIVRRYEGRKAAARRFWEISKLGLKLLVRGDLHKAKIVARGNLAGLFFNPRLESVDFPLVLDDLRYRPESARSDQKRYELEN